ncbi:MAG: fatty acid oxidation complex subunit alpha FadB [Pseudomonadales bacterium]|nr:fatty acid oxidation complex subunit alpha FadB [Pseudomonadales bacterium]
MIYEGQALSIKQLENDIAELTIDLKNESVNKFDKKTIAELDEALQKLASLEGVKALLVTSGKPVFVVGADITEFTDVFSESDEAIVDYLSRANAAFNRLEDLPYPTVVAINGFALGGGFEICMACDYRVMSTAARVGLPETKLGIFPGFGGTVRLPRIIGIDNAVEWIAGGSDQGPAAAMNVGAVDAVVEPGMLRDAALDLCQQCIDGKLDFQARRQPKLEPLKHNATEALMAFTTCKAQVAAKAGPNMPAPLAAVAVIEKAAKCNRDEALKIESRAFVEVARTPQADALVGIFLNDQSLAKKAKSWEKKSERKVARAGVLGAGIMGGGIAYQSAYRGTPIVMKDIAQAGIDLGLSEAAKLLSKRVDKGRMSSADMAATLNRIIPSLSYEPMHDADIVVEAVVENPKVKQAVLSEVEKEISDKAVIASNTSTISISWLAESLQRPQNFCGMHFFNPVHAMPLVEVIRGKQTSDQTIALTVAYANAMGKKAVVVNDCPGFLVNRVLFPYFAGFTQLVKDGCDFQKIDRVMEKWGWPMGPAYLCDVVGIDTCVHAADVLAEGFPDRMKADYKTVMHVMYEHKRLGQKNGVGFYDYGKDKRGRPTKQISEECLALIAPHISENRAFSDEEIIARMMVPMCTEMARCLDENIVESPAEADMSLVYGLGFPVFRGGVCRWMDTMGMRQFVDMADQYKSLGRLYEVTDSQRAMSANNARYFG